MHVFVHVEVYGGHERMLVNWVKRSAMDVCVWAASGTEFFVSAQDAGLKCNDAGYRKCDRPSRWDILYNAFKTWRIARRLPASSVVLLAPGAMQAGLTHLCAAMLGRGVVAVYVPMTPASAELGASFPSLRDALTRLLCRRVQAWVTITDTQRQQLERRWGVKAPVVVVPNWLPSEETSSRLEAMHEDSSPELPGRDLRVVYAGRFEAHQKGLDWLSSTISSRALELATTSWTFQGRGPFGSTLTKLSEALSPRVRIRPWGDTAAVLKEADLLILSSRFEGFPLIAVEALQGGVPVIASMGSGLADVLPENCLFELDDGSGLCRVLNSLRSPSSRLQALALSRQRMRELHSEAAFEAGIRRTHEVLHQLTIQGAAL